MPIENKEFERRLYPEDEILKFLFENTDEAYNYADIAGALDFDRNQVDNVLGTLELYGDVESVSYKNLKYYKLSKNKRNELKASK